MTFLTVRPPPRTRRPSPVTSSTSSTLSRTVPARRRRNGLGAAATTPPTVASAGWSTGHSWPPSSRIWERSRRRIPASTTATISAGS